MQQLIAHALREDIGGGDHTSLATVPKEKMGQAKLLVKEPGILAGLEPAMEVFKQVDPEIQCRLLAQDGSPMQIGDILFTVHGRIQSMLMAERLVLNIMQRMSGIATFTRKLCELISGNHARLLDTRKTTPGFRILEKEAVRIGGGYNHRFGLYDMILIKDNHVDAAGGVIPAIEAVRQYLWKSNLSLSVEIEVRNQEELKAVLSYGHIDRIMLDNFDVKSLHEAVNLVGKRYETEASGGIREDTIRAVAETGVDFISVGALTHHIHSLDLSLKIF